MSELLTLVESVVAEWQRQGFAALVVTRKRRWIEHFIAHCRSVGTTPESQLHAEGVRKFIRAYVRQSGRSFESTWKEARSMLHGWNRALRARGAPVPEWHPQNHSRLDILLDAYSQYEQRHRGLKPSTLCACRPILRDFLKAALRHGMSTKALRPPDVRIGIAAVSKTRSRLVNAFSVVRSFLRFLHVSGHTDTNLSHAVPKAPYVARVQPLRVLSSIEVRKLLDAIDCTSPIGMRDYAILLMMATYGMAASDVLALELDDLDFHVRTIRMRRLKTGSESLLPMLPTIGRALETYLVHARPRDIEDRHIFVRSRAPIGALRTRGAVVNSLLRRYVPRAGIEASQLSSHVFRRSFVTQQIGQRVQPRVISSILGHRSPHSIEPYTRIATAQLRCVCLRVPR